MKNFPLTFPVIVFAVLASFGGAGAQQAGIVPIPPQPIPGPPVPIVQPSGVTISLTTPAYNFSEQPQSARPGIPGFQATVTLANNTDGDIPFEFPTPLDAQRHFLFRVFDSSNRLVWDSGNGLASAHVITHSTLARHSAWSQSAFVPHIVKGSLLAPGVYTLEAIINGSPEFSANASFKVLRAINPPPPVGMSGIKGVALIGPIRPVEILGQPNTAPLPYAVIRVSGPILPMSLGALIRAPIFTQTVKADAQGRFQVAVPPGRYTVTGEPPNPGSPFPRGSTQDVTVKANEFTEITVQYDSGIR